MKHSFFAFFVIICAAVSFANDKVTLKSSLNEVTVYTQGAQLHHRANYTIKPGITEVVLEGITSQIDASSIQVRATGAVVILDSRFDLLYPAPGPIAEDGIPLKIKKSIKSLQDSLRTLSFDIQEVIDDIDVLRAAKAIITTNGAVRGQGKVNDSIQLLKQTVDYYTLKMAELNKKLTSLERTKARKMDQKSEMEARLRELQNYANNNLPNQADNNPIPRIIVTFSAKEAASGRIDFSYVISQAGWTPIYDIRSEAATGKISLTYKAQVHQNCGLDWNDVKLNISTNNPYANKTKPELSPWYIDYINYQEKALQEKRARADAYGAVAPSVNTQALNMGYAFTTRNNDLEALNASEFTKVVQQLVAAEFHIDLNYTIKSNNESSMVLIKQADLTTSFKYYSVPKLDPGVYLVAQMTKLDELQLVPAKANIFFDGSYIGQTYIDPSTMDDTLNLSLGKDPNIIVKRTLLKNQSKERIVQDKKERTFAYTVEVRNLKSSEIELVIQDQIPITQNPDITIEKTNLGKASFDEHTGLMEWTFKLKAKENKVIDYDFKIRHSKDNQINL
ncbi:MAG: hypothetical protein RLZZ301_1735 [Bacteroidota bacterium]